MQRNRGVDSKLECPLCYGEITVSSTGSHYVLRCTSTCLTKLLKPEPTKEAAIENFQSFKRELEMGSEMWGSKIRDGVAED